MYYVLNSCSQEGYVSIIFIHLLYVVHKFEAKQTTNLSVCLQRNLENVLLKTNKLLPQRHTNETKLVDLTLKERLK